MVEADSPWSSKSTARRRRRSSSTAVPIGLVMPHYTLVHHERLALTTRYSVVIWYRCSVGNDRAVAGIQGRKEPRMRRGILLSFVSGGTSLSDTCPVPDG